MGPRRDGAVPEGDTPKHGGVVRGGSYPAKGSPTRCAAVSISANLAVESRRQRFAVRNKTTMKIHLKCHPTWTREMQPTDARTWLLWCIGIEKGGGVETTWWVDVYWRPLLAFLAGGAGVTYLLATGLLALHFRQEPFNRITYAQVLLAPVAWEEFQEAQADSLIERGMDRLRNSHPEQAIGFLQAGLRRKPNHTAARLVLAELYDVYQPEHSIRLLENGLNYPPVGRPMLVALFTRLGQRLPAAERAAKARALVAQGSQLDGAAQFYLATVLPASIAFESGDVAAAREVLLAAKPASDEEQVELAELRLVALMREKCLAEARAIWEAAPREQQDRPSHLALGVELALLERRFDAVDELLARARSIQAGDPAPYLLELRCYLQLGLADKVTAVEKAFLDKFGADPKALKSWGAVALAAGAWPCVSRAIDHVNRIGADPAALWAQLAEFFFRQGMVPQAVTCAEQYRKPAADQSERDRGAELLVDLVLSCNDPDSARAAQFATAVTRQRGFLQPAGYKFIVEALERFQKFEAANIVASAAGRIYPGVVFQSSPVSGNGPAAADASKPTPGLGSRL